MIRAILFGIALPAVLFFTVFPWLLAAGCSFGLAAPFIVGSVIVAIVLGQLYRGALRTDAAGRRRIAFGITLVLVTLAVSGLNAMGISEVWRDADPKGIELTRAAMAEVAQDATRMEAFIAKERNDPNPLNGGDFSRFERELKQKRDRLDDLNKTLAKELSAPSRAWTATVLTSLFLLGSLWLGWRSVFQSGTGKAESRTLSAES